MPWNMRRPLRRSAPRRDQGCFSERDAARKVTRQGLRTQDRGNEPNISFRFNRCSERRSQSCRSQSPRICCSPVIVWRSRDKKFKLKTEGTNPKSPLDSTNAQKDEPKAAQVKALSSGQIVVLND
jgi:hypothetical protein